jgi:uncharacterized BrkB/YihY/UPF0761 family membrane protein
VFAPKLGQNQAMTRMDTPGDGERFLARNQRRARRLAHRASRRLAERRAASAVVDVTVRIYERDHENFGSVLGSAVAFRFFLFAFSMTALVVGLGTLVVGQGWVGSGLSDDLGITGTLAVEIDEALRGSETVGWILILGGLFGTLWTGKNLAATLIAASARAWQIPRDATATTVRAVGAVIGFVAVMAAGSLALSVIERAAGLAVVTTSFLLLFLVYGAAWFFLTLLLPRASRDPSVLLPGAALTGLIFMVLQWASQFYLVPRLESGSELLGGLGITAVALGWLFIVGRVMVASLAVNAVIFERLGSVLRLLLLLPGVRRIPERYPSVARLLEPDAGSAGVRKAREPVVDRGAEEDGPDVTAAGSSPAVDLDVDLDADGPRDAG